jgi:raffinose/stachyose/melibiose transport system permease protein
MKTSIPRLIVYLFVLVWASTEVFALFWLTYSSFKTTTQIFQNIWALPTSLYTSGYVTDLLGNGLPAVRLGQYIINSTIVSFASIAIIIAISLPTGYVLAKKSRLSTIVFYFLLVMIAVPSAAILLPVWYEVYGLGLLNTYLGLILPYVAFNVPFSIVLSRAFFRSFPKELEDAGRADGLSDFGLFVRIVLPLSTVIVVVLAIVNFPAVWNELLYALVIVPGVSSKTAQPGLLLFTSSMRASWNALF